MLALPPPAPQSLIPRAKIITNEPFVTTSGNALLPAIWLREDLILSFGGEGGGGFLSMTKILDQVFLNVEAFYRGMGN